MYTARIKRANRAPSPRIATDMALQPIDRRRPSGVRFGERRTACVHLFQLERFQLERARVGTRWAFEERSQIAGCIITGSRLSRKSELYRKRFQKCYRSRAADESGKIEDRAHAHIGYDISYVYGYTLRLPYFGFPTPTFPIRRSRTSIDRTSVVKRYLGSTLLLRLFDNPALSQRRVGSTGNNDMVVYGNPHQLAGFNQLTGDADVLPARFGIA